jgi:hypothetical protein
MGNVSGDEAPRQGGASDAQSESSIINLDHLGLSIGKKRNNLKESTENEEWRISVVPPEKVPDAWIRRFKSVTLFSAALIGVAVVCVVCIGVMIWGYIEAPPSADDRKWAMSLLLMVVTGGVAYLLPKRAE